ncbi:MAG: ParB/RepB/Spo0J family partition protein [Acutalibacteraceae bacterium]|nr:ParB/RepB/Spo0J family partition protein [Acutalibacteraceae bacterium]
MAKQRGLGKGLDALFSDNSVEDLGTPPSPVTLRLTEIEPNREQPRKTFDQKALDELAESIKKNGVLQPLLVRPLSDGSYQLVAGERRWRASRIAGLTEVPVIIKEMTDEQAMEIALIENLQREDLNPIEEAEGLQLLISRYNLTQDEAAARVGRSRPAVANSLRLLKLPDEILEMTKTGDISAGHARALLGFSSKEEMMQTAKEIKDKDLSVREIEKRIQESQKPEKKSARKKKTADVFYSEAELALSNSLGRKVKVIKGRKGGHLEIEFFDKDDLKKLAQELDRAES